MDKKKCTHLKQTDLGIRKIEQRHEEINVTGMEDKKVENKEDERA